MPTNLAVSDSALAHDSQYYDIDKWYAERILNLTDLTADGTHLPSDVAQTFPVLVCPRVSVQERERGCEKIPPEKMESVGKRSGVKGRQASNLLHNNHPSLKPVRLMCWLVQLFTDLDQLILDPFCGAGSTGIACKMLGRDFLGIDQNRRYSQIARARLRIWPAPRVYDPIPELPTYEEYIRHKPNKRHKEVTRQMAELQMKIKAMGGFRIPRSEPCTISMGTRGLIRSTRTRTSIRGRISTQSSRGSETTASEVAFSKTFSATSASISWAPAAEDGSRRMQGGPLPSAVMTWRWPFP
jgi:hypothetical protein